MCKDRIKSCVEQLKFILGPEFFKQQPDSKLEKAEILEMTVCFLNKATAAEPIAELIAEKPADPFQQAALVL